MNIDGTLIAEVLTLAAYFGVLLVLSVFGLHRIWIFVRYWKHRHQRTPVAGAMLSELPTVLIQLPIYNEGLVAARLIEAVARFEYPRDLLEIQVLDDSTDDTPTLIAPAIAACRAAGARIDHVRRGSRDGYKAGALAHGLTLSEAPFVAIFDADFVPSADYLQRTLPFFADAQIGLVQSRWEHLNDKQSALTRTQGMLIDGHFIIEQTARNRAGYFFSFNGTAGIWRRAAIDGAGGWRADTLTEDLDLSYRSQLAGWRFIYLPDFATPSELPATMRAFRVQQFRWTKGATQCIPLLLPTILRARIPAKLKLEASFHLLSNYCYVGMVALPLLLLPTLIARTDPRVHFVWMLDWPIALATTLPFALFYAGGQGALGRNGWRAALRLPAIIVLGTSLAVSNTIAVIQGLYQRGGEFVRTPKSAAGTFDELALRKDKSKSRQDALRHTLEAFLLIESLALFAYGIAHGMWLMLPYAITLIAGYGIALFEPQGRSSRAALYAKPRNAPKPTREGAKARAVEAE